MAIYVNINVLWAIYHAEVSSSPTDCQFGTFHASPTMKFYLNALPLVHYEFKKWTWQQQEFLESLKCDSQ